MLQAILFDLDGTLLNVDMDHFLPHYLKRLAGHFSELIDPQEFIPGLLESTQAMIDNLNPNVTNKEAFYAHFCSWLPYPEETVNPMIADFYENIFPQLQRLTRALPYTAEIMKTAQGLTCPLVLATNAIFPRQAILHRMNWAGLNENDFSLITTYENMHFCKPHPQYFLEIAEKIGVSPADCLMIGNDVNDDIAAAKKAGMQTYLAENLVVNKTGCAPVADICGTLEDIPAFLEKL